MDRIDVLGYRPDRHGAFTRELLAETSDTELQEIVQRAATELSSPIALVSLILDHIQFFKAFVGLPPALVSARGTHRDASFCQFVVRDGKAFEVNDAPNDPRIPQHVVKEYNIQAYLGVPVLVGDVVVGSLCVLDSQKRGFSMEDRSNLYKLAALVNKRLEVITKNRRQTRLDFTERALRPGIIELLEALKPIRHSVNAGYSVVANMRSFLDLTKHLLDSQPEISDALRFSFEAALKANQLNDQLLYDIESAAEDCEDCVNALEQLTSTGAYSHLSEVVISAQDLARNATKLVGGVPLPEFPSDPVLYTKRALAIAIITNCLLSVAAELGERKSTSGIRISVIEFNKLVKLIFSARDLDAPACVAIRNQLVSQLGSEPSVSIDSMDAEIRLTFKTINPDLAN